MKIYNKIIFFLFLKNYFNINISKTIQKYTKKNCIPLKHPASVVQDEKIFVGVDCMFGNVTVVVF
jgi:hypothetical protein